jgi:hypothetical protein
MNQTCTTVLLDLEYIGSTYQLLKQVYKEINADFKYADFNKYFGDKSLFIKAIETGYVSKGFFNPKTDTQDSNKNKNIIKFLDLIMTNEHKELAKSLAILVKKHQKESKLVYNHDVKIYDVKKKSDLIRNISEITDDFSYIDFITDDKLTKEDLYNFLAYSRAYFLTLKK